MSTLSDELLTLAEAAAKYSLTHDYLRQIARKGRLRARKIGRDWFTTATDVEEYLATRQKKGAYREDLQI